MNLNQEVASLLHLDGPHLVRDKFNTRKLIIAAADNGKVHDIDHLLAMFNVQCCYTILCQANICICSVLRWHLFIVTISHRLTTREGITGTSDTVTGITGISDGILCQYLNSLITRNSWQKMHAVSICGYNWRWTLVLIAVHY